MGNFAIAPLIEGCAYSAAAKAFLVQARLLTQARADQVFGTGG